MRILCSIAALLTIPAVLAPANAAPISIPPLSFSERTLPNGLRVYAMPDRTGTTVSVQVWYDVGGRDDPNGRSGFAHLFEHLMFKATRNMPSEEMMRLTEDVGGELNASTHDDFTEFHETAPANHLERLLWGEAERMGTLVVDQPTFVSERNVVEEELRGDEARPYDSLFRIDLPEASYTTSTYARPPIGNIANLDAATLEDVRAFHALYYRPDNAILVVSGNFDPGQLDRWVDRYFAPIVRPSWPIPHPQAVEPIRTAPKRYTLHASNIPLPAVVLSWQLPPADDPDRTAIEVLDALLSGGESSRLYQSLVYRDQLASETGSSADFRKGVGIFNVYALLSAGKGVDATEAALRREIGLLRDRPVTKEELQRVKNQIVTGTLKARETAEGRASTLAEDVIVEHDPHASDKRLAAIEALTPEAVQRVARRLLVEDRAIEIRYLPARPGAASAPVGVAASVVAAPLVPPAGVPIVTAADPAQRIPPPPAGPPIVPAAPILSQRHLANGLDLVVIERHALPIVTAYLVAGGGSSADPIGRSGLAELTAAVLTKGTTTRSATDIARSIEDLGGSIGADASRDGMLLSITVKADELARAMDVFADVAMHPAFAPAEIERQRAQALDGLSLAYNSPAQLASIIAARAVYGNAPYGKPADGTPASLRAIARQDLLAGYAAAWRPDAVTLVMAGDITSDQAQRAAEAQFAGWKAPRDAPPASSTAGPLPSPRTIVIDMPQAPQAAVMIARNSIARNDPRYYPLLVANEALGGGFGARLNQDIRVRRGLAYGAQSGFSARRHPGPFSAATQTKNSTVPQVIDLMAADMRQMGTSLVPAAELEARKAGLIGGFGRETETTDGVGSLVAGLILEGAPLSELERYPSAVAAVSPEQVRAVSQDVLDPAPASTIVVGDASQFVPSLRAAGTKFDLVPLAKLNLDRAELQ